MLDGFDNAGLMGFGGRDMACLMHRAGLAVGKVLASVLCGVLDQFVRLDHDRLFGVGGGGGGRGLGGRCGTGSVR